MIGFIEGKTLFCDGNKVIIKTQLGIGYEVFCNHLIKIDSVIGIFISHIIREAGQSLFGFLTMEDKRFFEILINVKGVGPKSAYSLISSLSIESIIQAIQYEDTKTLSKAPGIGKKAAAQIILDLTNKVDDFNFNAQNSASIKEASSIGNNSNLEVSESRSIVNEALEACKELGFKEDVILPIAKGILKNKTISSSEELLQFVLKEV